MKNKAGFIVLMISCAAVVALAIVVKYSALQMTGFGVKVNYTKPMPERNAEMAAPKK